MTDRLMSSFVRSMAALSLVVASTISAHSLREHGKAVAVADSHMSVTPARDWNKLGGSPGKNTETWTLDGEQLNNLTFYGGIPAGSPLVKERSKKKEPLPKVGNGMLLLEIPELLEGTYRIYRNTRSFQLTSSQPEKFLGHDGIHFMYEYIDEDQLIRKGEARATLIDGKLFMITFDAPRLYYFDRAIEEARALTATARLS
jgi:hypothetical protein